MQNILQAIDFSPKMNAGKEFRETGYTPLSVELALEWEWYLKNPDILYNPDYSVNKHISGLEMFMKSLKVDHLDSQRLIVNAKNKLEKKNFEQKLSDIQSKNRIWIIILSMMVSIGVTCFSSIYDIVTNKLLLCIISLTIVISFYKLINRYLMPIIAKKSQEFVDAAMIYFETRNILEEVRSKVQKLVLGYSSVIQGNNIILNNGGTNILRSQLTGYQTLKDGDGFDYRSDVYTGVKIFMELSGRDKTELLVEMEYCKKLVEVWSIADRHIKELGNSIQYDDIIKLFPETSPTSRRINAGCFF